MTDRTSCALVRLAVLAVLVLLAAFLACRPAWSPDGKKLLFPAQLGGERITIALYDRDTGKSEIVFTPPERDGFAVPMWTPDGKGAVILWSSKANEKKLMVSTLTIPPSGASKTSEVDTGRDIHSSLIVPAAVIGRRLFVTANGIARVDLDTGEVKRVESAKADRDLLVTGRGNGLCYVSVGKGDHEVEWELGTVDPETLEQTPLLQAPADRRWKVTMPSFSRDLRRIALPARDVTKGDDLSILVFADGKIEAVLPLGPESEAGFGSVDWAPDGVTLLLSLCRREERAEPSTGIVSKADTWYLYETTISGSVSRQTPIVTGGSDRDREVPNLLMPMALSPDGKTAAFSTAMLDKLAAEHHGLYLVDLTHKDRKVTHVPFPQPDEVRLMGSDTMLAVCGAFAEAFMLEQPSLPVSVSGGGSGVGIKALLDGDVELAMLSRPPKLEELAEAKKRGVVLVEHRVAFEALAICVAKDHPIGSITVEQLGDVFGKDGVTRWSELAVTMPAEHDSITRAGLQNHSGTHQYCREAVLGRGTFHPQTNNCNAARDVVEFVSRVPGSIGYVSAVHANDSVKLVPILARAGAIAVLPTPATIADGSYPLSRPLFLYSRGDSKPHVAKFLAWLGSDAGRKATETAGFFAAK